MGVRGNRAQSRKMFETAHHAVLLQSIQVRTRVDLNSTRVASKRARLQYRYRRIGALHIDYGRKVGIDAQLQQPLCRHRSLCKGYAWISRSSHFRSRWQIAMKGK